jgi:hypothetical protein
MVAACSLRSSPQARFFQQFSGRPASAGSHDMKQVSKEVAQRVQAELNELDRAIIDVDGMKLKPSQCYRFSLDPVHILFNTNCPDALKEKIRMILSKYAIGEQGA